MINLLTAIVALSICIELVCVVILFWPGFDDDGADDAWLDQITRRIVYSAVGHSKAND